MSSVSGSQTATLSSSIALLLLLLLARRSWLLALRMLRAALLGLGLLSPDEVLEMGAGNDGEAVDGKTAETGLRGARSRC